MENNIYIYIKLEFIYDKYRIRHCRDNREWQISDILRQKFQYENNYNWVSYNGTCDLFSFFSIFSVFLFFESTMNLPFTGVSTVVGHPV